MQSPPRRRRPTKNTSIRTIRIRRVVRNLANAAARFARRISRALEHPPVRRRDQRLQNVAKRVAHVRDGLALGDRLVDLDKALDEAAVLGVGIVEGVCDVDIGQVGLDGGVAGGNLQIDHDAVDEGDSAVDQRGVPDLGLAHFDSQAGDPVVDEGGFDAARLARVDLEGVGLEQFAQALDVGQAPVRVAPEACFAAGGGRVQVDAHVDLRGVGPDVVPDVVSEDVGTAAAGLGGDAGEDAVGVCEGA